MPVPLPSTASAWWSSWTQLTHPWPTSPTGVAELQGLVHLNERDSVWTSTQATQVRDDLLARGQAMWPTIWLDCGTPDAWDRLSLFFTQTVADVFPKTDTVLCANRLQSMPKAAAIVLGALINTPNKQTAGQGLDHFCAIWDLMPQSAQNAMAFDVWWEVFRGQEVHRLVKKDDLKKLLTRVWSRLPQGMGDQALAVALAYRQSSWVLDMWEANPPAPKSPTLWGDWAESVCHAHIVARKAMDALFGYMPETERPIVLQRMVTNVENHINGHVLSCVHHVPYVTPQTIMEMLHAPEDVWRALMKKPIQGDEGGCLRAISLRAPDRVQDVIGQWDHDDLKIAFLNQCASADDLNSTAVLEGIFGVLSADDRADVMRQTTVELGNCPSIQHWVMTECIQEPKMDARPHAM